MSRIIPFLAATLAATLLLGASAMAEEAPVAGRSVAAPAPHAAAPDARRAWFEKAMGDILEGRPRSNEDGAGHRAP